MLHAADEMPVQPSEYEKAVLRSEFIETMKQRFLNGEDEEFDYRYSVLFLAAGLLLVIFLSCD